MAMLRKAKVLLGLFLIALYLFYKVEFQVFSYLPGNSSLKLIQDPKRLPKKVFLLIIDSLRFDFYPYLPLINKYKQKYPESTYFAKVDVDYPTMTTERIESMMVGSQIFSSRVIASSFVGAKIEADNIIDQLKLHNKTSAVFGDGTWNKTFNLQNSDVYEDTFNIFDQGAIDTAAIKNTLRLVMENDTQNFIISHFLEADHLCHSYQSIPMEKILPKLRIYEQFFLQAFEKSQDNTLFIITGDHGMTRDGTHGGNSKEERQTFLFGYYKGGVLFNKALGQQQMETISQIDLTTTLSILLDIPLPKNAVGYPILNLLPKQLVSQKEILEINSKVVDHFVSMLDFYGRPISQMQLDKIKQSLEEGNIDSQKEQVKEVAKKLNFLRFTYPGKMTIVSLVVITGLITFTLISLSFRNQIRQIRQRMCRSRIRGMIILLLESTQIFTLFVTFCSWSSMILLSDILLGVLSINILIGVLLSPLTSKRKIIYLCIVFALLFVLAQTDPDVKISLFKTSSIKLDKLKHIFTHKLFNALLIFIELLAYLRYELIKPYLNSKTSYSRYIRMLIAVLAFSFYISAYILGRTMHSVAQLHTVLIVWYIMSFWVLRIKASVEDIKFITIAFLSVFMGPQFPLVLLVCLILDKCLHQCSNYAVLMSLLSKLIWWFYGTVYDYSSINIVRTYIYSENFSLIFNGVALIMYLNAPFALNLILLNCRMFNVRQNSSLAQDQEQPSKHKPVASTQSFQEQIFRRNIKFLAMLLLAILICMINLIIQAQDLGFTIVHIPTFFLTVAYTVPSVLIVLIILLCFSDNSEQFQPIYDESAQVNLNNSKSTTQLQQPIPQMLNRTLHPINRVNQN